MYLYIEAIHLESNYSGPYLFQITEINNEIYEKFDFVCKNTKLKFNSKFRAECEDKHQVMNVEYVFKIEKIKYILIDKEQDVLILKKVFGTNFCNYDFIKQIFTEDFLKIHRIYEDNQIQTNFIKFNLENQDQKMLMIYYKGMLDSTLIFDISFNKKRLKILLIIIKKILNIQGH